MIDFSCASCGRSFSVPDAAAGRQAKCKCGASVTVPAKTGSVPRRSAASSPPVAAPKVRPAVPPPAPPKIAVPAPPLPIVVAPAPVPVAAAGAPTARKLPMRTRRLMADAQQIAQAFDGFTLISVRPRAGDPPDVYQIEYAVKGLELKGGKPVPRQTHRVEIQLTSDYPRMSPKCKMLTPIFHPNIDPATICVGDHWTAGERLVDLIVRIGEMIAFQAYNIKSPLDGEAAMWCDLNPDQLPTDHRSLRPPGME